MDRHNVLCLLCNLRLVHLRPLTIYLALEDWELDQHTVQSCQYMLVMTKGNNLTTNHRNPTRSSPHSDRSTKTIESRHTGERNLVLTYAEDAKLESIAHVQYRTSWISLQTEPSKTFNPPCWTPNLSEGWVEHVPRVHYTRKDMQRPQWWKWPKQRKSESKNLKRHRPTTSKESAAEDRVYFDKYASVPPGVELKQTWKSISFYLTSSKYTSTSKI